MPSSAITGKPQLNRRVNRTLILDRIRLNGRISRAELAKTTDIRPPTVTAIIRELLAEGLVIEVGRGETRSGRAPRILTLSCRRPRAAGFELTDTAILAGLSDLKGNLSIRRRVPYTPESPERTVERLATLAEEMFVAVRETAHDREFGWRRLGGVGIALPGLLDTARGMVSWSRPLRWRDVALRDLCERRWGVRTDIVNDSAAGSMAAHFFADDTTRNLVYIVLRFADASNGVVGIGTGLIVQGEPYHGEFGTAGEITTPVPHPLGYVRDAAGQPYADTAALLDAVKAGHAPALAGMDRLATDLSLLVLHAIDLLDPGRVIIEADVTEVGEALRTRLGRILDEHALRHKRGRAEIVVSTLGEFGGVRGAVVPALRRFFKLPSWP